MGNATRMITVVVRDFHLCFSKDRILILRDCLYIPNIRRNLVLISKLVSDRYNV